MKDDFDPRSDIQKLEEMVEETASAMFAKLQKKHYEEYVGWDNAVFFTKLIFSLDRHLVKFVNDVGDTENIINVMNLFAMIRRMILEGKIHPPEKIEFVFDSRDKIKVASEKVLSIEELRKSAIEDETKELPERMKFEFADGKKAEEKMKDILNPNSEARKAMEKAGLKFKGVVRDKKSLDISPLLPEGAEAIVFFPIKNYVYIDEIRKGVHRIRIAQIDFGVFLYQILSIPEYDNENEFDRFRGSEEELFALIKKMIVEYFSEEDE